MRDRSEREEICKREDGWGEGMKGNIIKEEEGKRKPRQRCIVRYRYLCIYPFLGNIETDLIHFQTG